jgi:predicted NUDIX family NTP pyrophosphohydrolase
MRQSAGILLYRHPEPATVELFLVHPGGPYWADKDLGVWSIPKGEPEVDEELLSAARREFFEETGFALDGPCVPLGAARQDNGKVVHIWTMEGDVDASKLKSNTCSIQWPPHSGQIIDIPEVDRGEWFSLPHAYTKLYPGQHPFLDALKKLVQTRAAPLWCS